MDAENDLKYLHIMIHIRCVIKLVDSEFAGNNRNKTNARFKVFIFIKQSIDTK